jgi:cytoskeletal protein RodZ
MSATQTKARPRKLTPGVEIESPRESVLDCEFPVEHQGKETMASFGEELRRHRELRSISLREISDATKINIRFLEALEQNDFKHLPGGQFNKGFIRAYARHIGISEDEMVGAYLLETKTLDEGSRTAARASSAGGPQGINIRMIVAGALAALLLVAMAAVTWSIVRSSKKAPQPQDRLHTSGAGTARPPKSETAPGSGAASPEGAPHQEQQQEKAANGAGPAPAGGGSPAVPEAPQGGSGAGQTGAGGERSETGPAGGPGAPPIPEPALTAPAPTPAPATTSPADAAAGSGALTGQTRASRADSGSGPRHAAAAGGNLTLRVISFHSVRFELLCSGKPLHSGALAVGAPLTFDCQGVYEVSLEDAGAVSMSINGERIYLGRPGQAIMGRHVSAANYQDFVNAPSEAAPQ